MIKLDRNSVIGKVYQISKDLLSFVNDNFMIIQIQDTPLPFAILCPEESKVIHSLSIKDTRDVVIAPITALEITDELVSRIRIVLCQGRNVYVFTRIKTKLWFVDEKI